MYDIIIVGAGTAGISAYKEARKYTNNLLIINEGPWDTTCARVGCMPSKLLIAAANRIYEIQHANEFGLNLELKIDTQNVMQRVQNLRDRFTKSTLKDVDSWPAEHKLSGRATFINSNTLVVNKQQYQAKHIILAVGSTPNIDANLQEKINSRLLSTDQIFDLPELPKSIAVIGSGVIAVELAQAMNRLGVKTDIFARSRKIGTLTSQHLQQLAQEELSKALNIHFETLPDDYQLSDQGVILTFTEQGKTQTLNVEYVLTATGRRTLLTTLNLENVDASFQELKHLPVHPDTKQLKDYPIYNVGDAYTSTPIQHMAAHEGKQVVQSIFTKPQNSAPKKLTPLAIVFSSPQMASVGQIPKQLTEQGIDYVTGFVDYSKQGRALVNATNQGAVEIYVDKTSRKVLGAELFCYEAEHLAHILAWMIDESLTVDELLNKPFYHPTIEEGLRTALKHARRQLNTN